jgi:hypothetical protein
VIDLLAIRILRECGIAEDGNDGPDDHEPLEDRMNLRDYSMNFHS